MSATLDTLVVMPSGIMLGIGYTSYANNPEEDYVDRFYSFNPTKEKSLKWGMRPISKALFDRVKRIAENSPNPNWWVKPVLSQDEIEAQIRDDIKYKEMMRWE